MTASALTCGACGLSAEQHVGQLPLYVRDGDLATHVWKCRHCGTYMRDVPYAGPAIKGHFEIASYTDLQTERKLFERRRGFFLYLLNRAQRHLRRPWDHLRVLDIGCSFGHMMQLLRERGTTVCGVEPVDALRQQLVTDGLTAYASVNDVPASDRFDLVTMIDSLYYMESPADVLTVVQRYLEKDGLLLIRVANRTPILSLLQLVRRPITNAHFGDAKYNFSVRGIGRLLARSGFRIEKVYLWERGKRGMPALTRLYYQLSLAASVLTRIKLTPGIIVICRHDDARRLSPDEQS